MRGYETSKSDYGGRIEELEKEISKTKYNKKTQHHIGMLKAKIAELKEKSEQKAKGSGVTSGYAIKKSGDATVAFLGFPSVGKSTLLNALTKANSKIGAYDFTTLTVVPGLLDYQGAKIQVYDVPGIVDGAADGSGKGKEVLSSIRAAELIVIVLDMNKPEQLNRILKEAYDAGLRLNKRIPDVKIEKTGQGGVDVVATCRLKHLTKDLIKNMMHQMGMHSGHVTVREDITDDQLIDVFKKNRVYIPSLIVINKADINPEKAEEVRRKVKGDVCVSAEKKQNIEDLKELIFTKLGLVRIYLKNGDKQDDKPLILKNPATIRAVCNKIHRSFIPRFKNSKVWGSSKFPGQVYGLDKRIKDKDTVEINLN